MGRMKYLKKGRRIHKQRKKERNGKPTIYRPIGIMVRVFANGLGNRGSIPG